MTGVPRCEEDLPSACWESGSALAAYGSLSEILQILEWWNGDDKKDLTEDGSLGHL